jgi:serine protease Do
MHMREGKRFAILLPLVAAAMFFAPLPCAAAGFDIEEAYASVVVVHAGNRFGSGFAVGENHIVTNAHVVDANSRILLQNRDGKSFKAELSLRDEEADIAVLRTEDAFRALPLDATDETKIGDDVYAIGAPDGMAYTVTKGILSAKDRRFARGANAYLQIDAPINSGNSGGPLLNDAGRVIGVNTLKVTGAEGIGLAIPSSVLIEYLLANGLARDESGAFVADAEKTPVDASAAAERKAPSASAVPARSDALTRVLLCASLLLNLAFIVCAAILLPQKRRKAKVEAPAEDPRDRMNFDIDILE